MNHVVLTHETPDQHTRHPHLESKGIFTRTIGGITVHAVRCGWIKYRNAHIHSKLGPYLVLLDPTWIDWAPVFAWVIEHPEGILLIDTGLTEKALGPDLMKGGMVGWLNRTLAKANFSGESDIQTQLGRLGISRGEVRWVALTHLHLDHASGIEYFPDAEFLVPYLEYVRPYGAVESAYPAWFKPSLITHVDEIGGVFETGHVLTKAGDVILVSTPGHTYNHQSVILKTKEGSLFLQAMRRSPLSKFNRDSCRVSMWIGARQGTRYRRSSPLPRNSRLLPDQPRSKIGKQFLSAE